MRRAWCRSLTMFVVGCAWLACLMGGCGGPTREDRTIQFSEGGDNVGFQHGQEGLYVAGKEGQQLEKIFQPSEEVIASSTPLWSPTDGRLIFTTAARPPSDEPQTAEGLVAADLRATGEQDPAGNVYHAGEVIYTCWIRDEAKDPAAPPPRALFEARCDHAGYVAANLAVRWSPDGKSVYYVDQLPETQPAPEGALARHGLFEFRLDEGETRRVALADSQGIVFDWSPDGQRLACVLGGNADPAVDGVWIGAGQGDDWWHVPGTESLTDAGFSSLLELLQAARPAWSPDGSQFAFTTSQPAPTPEALDHHRLWLGKVAEREVVELADSPDALRHVHWDPSGSRLGLVQEADIPSLHLLTPGEGLSPPLSQKHVRHFAGWNADGTQLAYIVPQDDPQEAQATWAFLLPPDPWARDEVVLAAGNGAEPGETVFSGMRVTFPHWSPRENKLTLWVTYTPSHPSWLSRLMSWGLRPGDPAAVFDVATQKLSWLAVNPQEKIQIGHYHLARREYEEAWRWYAEAAAERPAPQPPTVVELFQRLTSPSDPEFFEYYCLSKLGRDEEAAAKLQAFRSRHLLPAEPVAAAGEPAEDATAAQAREWLAAEGLFAHLAEDLYISEVYLSLGAGEDGVAYFRGALAEAPHDQARLAAAVALGQVLLNEGQHGAYAELTTETIAPTLHRLWPPGAVTTGGQGLDDQSLLYMAGSLSLLPLCAPEFLATLPEDQLVALTGRWEGYAGAVSDDASRLAIDLVLAAAYEQLGREEDARAGAVRIEGNPARGALLGGEDVRQMIERLRHDGSN